MKFRPLSLKGNPIVYGTPGWKPRRQPHYRATQARVRRVRSGIIPFEQEYGMSADVVIDEPRQPKIMPTGVLDSRGMMILRVLVPITQKMGFGNRFDREEDEGDYVESLVPEDMLMVTDVHGHGLASFDTSEIVPDDDDDD